MIRHLDVVCILSYLQALQVLLGVLNALEKSSCRSNGGRFNNDDMLPDGTRLLYLTITNALDRSYHMPHVHCHIMLRSLVV
ncbi:hypothetical protein CC80DRAFT_146603 [Byssothecium circinans]|uniref:Plastocyanin-like domain-containing protein n=1 Tax=Byssothecium circinans TaxID=147558 RepID=A0A6A5TWL2_9PLEO|nr:hypothetical protein CC80DRAFT_146603 [Byssothecium circinans]